MVFISLTYYSPSDIMTGVAMYRSRNLLQYPEKYPVLPDAGFDIIPEMSLCHNR